MNFFGGYSPWATQAFGNAVPLKRGLGQTPLILGPSSWGAAGAAPLLQAPIPPFVGQWGVVNHSGQVIDSGQVGPFDSADEAFAAAAEAAVAHGATALPTDGFAQVIDAAARPVGPAI